MNADDAADDGIVIEYIMNVAVVAGASVMTKAGLANVIYISTLSPIKCIIHTWNNGNTVFSLII